MGIAQVIDLVSQANQLKNDMADPAVTDLRTQAGRAACDAYASNPAAVEVAFSTSGVQGGVAARAAFDDMCAPYWANEGTDPPVVTPPLFSGGQCVCQDYRITFDVLRDGTLIAQIDETRAGPISITVTDQPDLNFRVEIDYGQLPGCNQGTSRPTNIARNPGESFAIANLAVSPVGFTDDCGSLPPQIDPGPNNPGTPFGSPQTRPVGGTPFDFIPTVDDDPATGGPNIRIDSPFGPLDIQPLAESPASPVTPVEGEDVAGGQPSGEEDAPEGENVIGYSWRFTGIPVGRGGIAAKDPLVFAEVIGSLQLRLESANMGVYYMQQAVVREQRGAVFRPAEGVKVSGVSWSFKPSFGTVEIRPISLPEA